MRRALFASSLVALASVLAACGGITDPGDSSNPGSDPGSNPGSSNPAACSTHDGTVVTFDSMPTNASFRDGRLYFDSDGLTRISSVSVGGGAIETLLDHGGVGEWAAGGGVFAWETEPVVATPSDSTYVDQLHIRDAAGHVTDFPETTNGSDILVHVDAQGNVFWIPPDRTGITRWDHATGQATPLATGPVLGAYVLDAGSLFWIGEDRHTIFTMSNAGGTPQKLATVDGDELTLGDDFGEDGNLYVRETVTRPGSNLGGPPTPRLHAVSKATGATSIVFDQVAMLSNVAVDEHDLYWISAPEGTGDYIGEIDLVREPRGGGTIETMKRWKTTDVSIPGEGYVGVDACNVYMVGTQGLIAVPKG